MTNEELIRENERYKMAILHIKDVVGLQRGESYVSASVRKIVDRTIKETK